MSVRHRKIKQRIERDITFARSAAEAKAFYTRIQTAVEAARERGEPVDIDRLVSEAFSTSNNG
jgi:hypothetical protein